MKYNFLNKKIRKNGGFTLIELMVATTIFTSVILMALGSLIVAVDGTKKAQALRVSMDNVNFAMESMSRNLRTGTIYQCGGGSDCQGGTSITFKPGGNTGPSSISYRRNGNTLEKCISSGCQSMVADNVIIDDLRFYVNGTTSGDSIQPSVYIKMKGYVLVRGVSTPFYLQTLASQRAVLD